MRASETFRVKFFPEFVEVIEAGVCSLTMLSARTTVPSPHLQLDYLLRLAQWHGMVLPIWEQTLRQCDFLTPVAVSAWKDSVQILVKKLLASKVLIEQLSQRAADRNLRPVFFKGLAFKKLLGISELASDPGDIDILVHPAELEIIEQILSGLACKPVYEVTPAKRQQILSSGEGVAYCNQSGICVDVHQSLSLSYAAMPSIDAIWTEGAVLSDGTMTLSVAQYGLYLAVHGLKHRWSRVAWIHAYAHLVEQLNDASVEALIADAQKRSLLTPVLVAHGLAHVLFGTQLPRAVDEKMRKHHWSLVHSFAGRFCESLYQKYFRDLVRVPCSLDTLGQGVRYIVGRSSTGAPNENLFAKWKRVLSQPNAFPR